MNSGRDHNSTCHRCGTCCQLDMTAYVSRDDIGRWEKEGRHDILAHVRDYGVTWSDTEFVNRFGSNIKTCLMSCVYLEWDGSTASCSIYETRTKVCRNYVPGSSELCPQHHRQQTKSPIRK